MKLILSASMIATVLVANYVFNKDTRESASQSFKRSVGITAYHVARQREGVEEVRDALSRPSLHRGWPRRN